MVNSMTVPWSCRRCADDSGGGSVVGGAEDEIAVDIGGRVCAVGQFRGRDVTGRVGIARRRRGARGVLRR